MGDLFSKLYFLCQVISFTLLFLLQENHSLLPPSISSTLNDVAQAQQQQLRQPHHPKCIHKLYSLPELLGQQLHRLQLLRYLPVLIL